MGLDLYDELHRVGRALDEGGVAWALVGGLALAIHGAPRATTDIDLLVRPEDVDRALELVRPLGFRLQAGAMQFPDGMRIRRVTKLSDGDALTLDLLLVDEPLAEVWASRMPVETELGTLQVIGREALIRMKIWSGRPRDLADVARLEEDDR